jgi:hypothetical protein
MSPFSLDRFEPLVPASALFVQGRLQLHVLCRRAAAAEHGITPLQLLASLRLAAVVEQEKLDRPVMSLAMAATD